MRCSARLLALLPASRSGRHSTSWWPSPLGFSVAHPPSSSRSAGRQRHRPYHGDCHEGLRVGDQHDRPRSCPRFRAGGLSAGRLRSRGGCWLSNRRYALSAISAPNGLSFVSSSSGGRSRLEVASGAPGGGGGPPSAPAAHLVQVHEPGLRARPTHCVPFMADCAVSAWSTT